MQKKKEQLTSHLTNHYYWQEEKNKSFDYCSISHFTYAADVSGSKDSLTTHDSG